MKRLLLCLTLTLATLVSAAHAQLGVYAGYTAAKLDVGGTPWIYGPTFGAYYDAVHLPVLNLGGDARVHIIDSNSTTTVTSFLLGPRAALHLPVIPLRPYGEALIGVASSQTAQGGPSANSTGAAFGLAVGADAHLLPYLDWRVLDYSYTRLQGSDAYQKALTTGLVLRLPLT